MAKGNLLLGMGRGKLGDIVLSRAYGEQISRARAKVVKNPRTTGQQVQRIILATVTKAYSQMKPIVNHSWQGVSYGAASMNKFNKLNMDFLRNQLGAYGLDNFDDDPTHWAWFITQGNTLAVPNRWRISTGSLPSISITPAGNNPEATRNVELYRFAAEPPATLSYRALVDAMGIQDGDQLTLCAIARDGKFHYGRFICSPSDGDMTHSVTDTQFWNERNTNVSLAFADSVLNMGLPSIVAEDTYLTAAGVILSRRQGTTWQRSNSEMTIWSIDYAGIGASMNTALYELETGEINLASPYYLNNANNYTAEEGDGENP